MANLEGCVSCCAVFSYIVNGWNYQRQQNKDDKLVAENLSPKYMQYIEIP